MRLRSIVAIGCMVAVLLTQGCHNHWFGRYYHGREPETVLMKTPDIADEEPVDWTDGDWVRPPGSARPMPKEQPSDVE